jgi:hypothetical protein
MDRFSLPLAPPVTDPAIAERWRRARIDELEHAIDTFRTTEARLLEWRSALSDVQAADDARLLELMNEERAAGD